MIQVAVDAPLNEPLSYLENPDHPVKIGDWVKVPLGRRQVLGCVVGFSKETEILDKNGKAITVKPITEIVTEWPSINEKSLEFYNWVSKYYIYPLGQVTVLALPPLAKAKKNIKSKRAPVIPKLEAKLRPTLTEEQAQVIKAISISKGFSVHLVRGVTGSGKTEVYLNLFEKCLQEGKKGIFLVPEISLTPQLINRFVERFGDQVAVLHSQLTDRERTNQWFEMVEGDKKILIGARSALFCPMDSLGLIIVDEEHESSFKQDEKLKYNGRDASVVLGKINNCPVILGSATPSLESWKNYLDGKYQLHSLNSRVANRPLPDVSIVDMRVEKENPKRPPGLPFWLSQNLYVKMAEALEKKEQSAILLNRRGMANLVFCRTCGYSAECPNCDVSLILHAKSHLVCHYCDYQENYQFKCPDCNEGELAPMGLGTEKIEQDLKELFPEARVARADRDEISSRLEMETLVHEMEQGKIDILVGTQMIAKGLDFPKLNLVGLALADVGFNLPDFRATEKSFQLIVQMSGRAGRHQKGEVLVQTYNTEHESLTYSQHHDYLGFAENELKNRLPLNYPPFQKMIAFRVQSLSLLDAQNATQMLKSRAEHLIQKFPTHYSEIELLGPAFAPLAKIKNQHRMHFILKGPSASVLNQFARQILADEKWIPAKVKLVVDVDPINLL